MRTPLARILAVVALAAVVAPSAHAQFGTNLIVNPGAEAGAGSASGNDVLPVPGWATSNGFTVVQYGAPDFPTSASPGPAGRGLNFFSGGPDNSQSSAVQMITLGGFPGLAGAIDGGGVTFDLSGWFGGFDGQDDNLTLTATFLDGTSGSLGSSAIGGVTSAPREGITGMLFRAVNGTLPVGTRSVSLRLLSNRLAGSYNDGYGDNLAFVLAGQIGTISTPEPATFWLLGAALPLLGLARRRRSS